MEVQLNESQVIRLRMLANHRARCLEGLIEEIQAENDPQRLLAVPMLKQDVVELKKVRKALTDAFEQLEFDEVVEM